jgi:protoheme IX farnesyltransferase
MSTPAAPSAVIAPQIVPTPAKRYSRLDDLSLLLKLRVTSLVVMTAWTGFYLASQKSGISSLQWSLLHALLGIGLVSGGAAALNQVIERQADGLMHRTRMRPLPAGRMTIVQGLTIGLAAVFLGAAYLALTTNLLAALLTLATAASYVGLYTPLKKHSPVSTTIGAFPGAMPPLLGWVAARGKLEWEAVVLFAILFLWQFPHFHAIAWLYRDDYERAGIRMLAVVEKDGRSTVREVLANSMILVPVSLFPALLHMVGITYVVGAFLLGIGLLAFAVRFARLLGESPLPQSRRDARHLLRASIIYLPLLFGLMMLNARVAW